MGGYTIVVTRNNIDESFHDIDIVNDKSSEDFGYFPRSAIKPFQMIPLVHKMLEQDIEINLQEVAMFCASHSGEVLHTKQVVNTAKKYSLDYEDIFCEKQIPFHAETYKNLLVSNEPFTKLHNNCSGKHVGMLLFCKLLNLDFQNYQNLDHPLQQVINSFYEELFDLEDINYGIDGCGLPAPYINTKNFLAAVNKLNHSDKYHNTWQIIFDAFVTNPVHTAGTDRVDTILMQNSPNEVLIKAGAEGSMFFTDLNTSTILKCRDGSKRGVDIASMYFGKKAGYITEDTYSNFIKTFTHNNQNSLVAGINVLEN